MDLFNLYFLILIFAVAYLYSSIGHGGASGYLALMAIFNFDPSIMKGSALFLNIFVSGIAFYQYYKRTYFRWKLFLPLALSSVPMAFLGGIITLDTTIYKRILALCLIFAILRILGLFGKEDDNQKKYSIIWCIIIGLSLGFISGLIGIGGGIMLSPLLIILGWTTIKEAAVISALFIFVNSIAGLSGNFVVGFQIHPQIYLWIIMALTGGALGAYSGAKKFNNTILIYILAIVLLIASIKLIGIFNFLF